MKRPPRALGQAAQIRPAPCPPTGGTPPIPLVGAYGRAPRKFICLSESVVGYLLHFVDAQPKPRTMPHTGTGTFCTGCQQGKAIRWKGFVCALQLPTYKRCILEITAGAYQFCPDLANLAGNLRGRVIEVQRMYDSKNSPVRASVGEKIQGAEKLKPAWDLHASLLRLWGFATALALEGPDASRKSVDSAGEEW